MKIITMSDCLELRRKFDSYCQRADRMEYEYLMMVDREMKKTFEAYDHAGHITTQDGANKMFRVVLNAIHEDYSEYEREWNGE